MSSADTCILSQSVILTEDIIKRFYHLEVRKTVLFTRLSISLLGILALSLALLLKGVIASLLFAYTIFSCGLVVPVIAGFYKEKIGVNSEGALAALIGGGLIVYLSLILKPKIQPFYAHRVTIKSLVGVAKTINYLYGLDAKVKWPNDVLIRENKIGGVLAEMTQ